MIGGHEIRMSPHFDSYRYIMYPAIDNSSWGRYRLKPKPNEKELTNMARHFDRFERIRFSEEINRILIDSEVKKASISVSPTGEVRIDQVEIKLKDGRVALIETGPDNKIRLNTFDENLKAIRRMTLYSDFLPSDYYDENGDPILILNPGLKRFSPSQSNSRPHFRQPGCSCAGCRFRGISIQAPQGVDPDAAD